MHMWRKRREEKRKNSKNRKMGVGSKDMRTKIVNF